MNIFQRITSKFKGVPLTVNRKIALKNCAIADIRYDEPGEETGQLYHYYHYIHISGRRIIMREKDDETEYRYASGLFANRQTLTYRHLHQL